MRGKQILAVVLSVMCLVTEITPAWAQGTENVQESIDAVGTDYITSADGLYTYEVKTEDGEECIYLESYQGNETNVIIPECIDGYTVRGILLTTLFPNDYPVETVKLPNTITSIAAGAFATTYSLKSISIDSSSRNGFYTEDGILYCNDILVAYPAAKDGETYIVPQHITKIMREAFYGCSNLKRVVIHNLVTDIGRGTFTRCKSEMNIVLKRNSLSDTYISYLNSMCCEVASGTKIMVKTNELKEKVLGGMTATNVYKDSTDTMAVEVMESVPATSLTFTDGSTEQYATISYTDTGTTASEKNTFYLQSLYQQEPYDTTDNVTWSLQSGTECPGSTNHACEVTSGGTIITYSGGEAVLVGKDESGHEITLHVTVHSPMESAKFLDDDIFVLVGDSEYDYIKITPYKSYASNVGVSWASADTSIATVEQKGLNGCNIYGMDVGTTTLTATINNDGTLVEELIPVRVYDYITNCTVDPIPTQTYRGEQLKPTPVVRYKGRVLTEGVDYQIVGYGQNNFAGEKVGYVCINGLNTTFLKGSTTLDAEFDIVDGRSGSTTNSSTNEGTVTDPSDDAGNGSGNNNAAEITGVKSSYTKTYGSKNFKLKAKGPKSVTYTSNNKKVVTVGSKSGTVVVKGIGTATITIKSGKLTKKVTIKVIPRKVSSVKVKSGKKSIKVSWKKDKSVSGYQIQYAMNSKFTKGKKTVTIKKNKTTSYTIKKLKSKKKYFVHVRAYKTVNGKKYYSDWSKAVSMKTK